MIKMGLISKAIFVILVFIAIAHFFPQSYDSGREWLADKVSTHISEPVGSGIETVADITNQEDETPINTTLSGGGIE